MKRKGFTLVELLAVIVILAVIAIITIPMIGNVIEDSKKKALETSVYGLVEAANYFAIYNNGKYGFVFNEKIKGKTEDEEYALEYNGEIDAEGKLYINVDKDVSLCLMNEKYYVYKNYNSGIIIGDRSKDSCVAEYDPLTNKYIAYLEGEGEGSNVYSKDEVDNLLVKYALQTSLDNTNTNVSINTEYIETVNSQVNQNKEDIKNIQTQLGSMATTSNIDNLTLLIKDNEEKIADMEINLNSTILKVNQSFQRMFSLYNGYDLNSLTTSGFYTGVELINAPVSSTGNWCSIIVTSFNNDPNYVQQLAMCGNGTSLWLRAKNGGGGWSEWKYTEFISY